MMGGVILALGIWVTFAVATIGSSSIKPAGHAWVVSGSEKIGSRPDLVRVAFPVMVAKRWPRPSLREQAPQRYSDT
jgi:hypothetical protein